MEVFVQNSPIHCIFRLPSVTDHFNPNIQFPDRICYSDTLVQDWKNVGLEGFKTGRVQNWKGEGMEECKIGKVEDLRSVGLEECRIGRV